MKHAHLIVPGWGNSGTEHWQTWLENQLPNTQRISGVDWEKPVLTDWAKAVRDALDQASMPVWIIAHSFGCLASAVATIDRREKVAGVLFAAPADPHRFCLLGRREEANFAHLPSIEPLLPQGLATTGYLVASLNDPWMSYPQAVRWAERWGLTIHNAGAVGHLNVASGFGAWPEGLALLHRLQQMPSHTQSMLLQSAAGRGSQLSKVRLETRKLLGVCS